MELHSVFHFELRQIANTVEYIYRIDTMKYFLYLSSNYAYTKKEIICQLHTYVHRQCFLRKLNNLW